MQNIPGGGGYGIVQYLNQNRERPPFETSKFSERCEREGFVAHQTLNKYRLGQQVLVHRMHSSIARGQSYVQFINVINYIESTYAVHAFF